MGSHGIEFVSTQEVVVKFEDIDEDPFTNQSWISSSRDQISDKKCGEIFTLDYEQLRFVCAFCNGSYDNICEFGDHLRLHYFKFLDNLDSNTHATECDNVFIQNDIPGGQSSGRTTENTIAAGSVCDEGEQHVIATELNMTSYSIGDDMGKVEIPSTAKEHSRKLCKKGFENSRTLCHPIRQSPVASILDKADSNHVCSSCKNNYSSKGNLMRHNCRGYVASTNESSSIQGRVVRDYTCSVCKREYASKRNLRRHNCSGFVLFTNKRPSIRRKPVRDYVCNVCKKKYASKRNLMRHNCRGYVASTNESSSIPDRVVRDYTCSVCKKKYANNRNLRRHNCPGFVVPINKSEHDKTKNTNCSVSAVDFEDTEMKGHAVLKAVHEENCRNFTLIEQFENCSASIADSAIKGENKCEDPSELSPKTKGGELANILAKDEVESVERNVCKKLLEPTSLKCLQTTNKYQCNSFSDLEKYVERRCAAPVNKPNIVSVDDLNKEVTFIGATQGKGNSTEDTITNPDFYCDICKKQFHKYHFRRHGMLHAEPPSAMKNMPDYLKCKYCGVQVMKHSDWLPHERTHCGHLRYVCPYCSKVFKRGAGLRGHINYHTGARPYKCDHCPATFAHYTNRLNHKRRIHLREHPYKCSYCPVKCLNPSELRLHMKRHTGDKAYQCEVCGKSFITATKLRDHFITHSTIKNVKCPLCPMVFAHKKRLAPHMITHSNEKLHTCDVCGDKFSRPRSLVVHKKLHLPEKKYVCPICGKAFAQFAGLYSHKKSHREIVG